MSQARRSAVVDGFLNRQFSGLVTRLRREAGKVDDDKTRAVSDSSDGMSSNESGCHMQAGKVSSDGNNKRDASNTQDSVTENDRSECLVGKDERGQGQYKMDTQPSPSSLTNPTKPTLLTLPYEIRHQILTFIYTPQPFLSSKQQVSASDQRDLDTLHSHQDRDQLQSPTSPSRSPAPPSPSSSGWANTLYPSGATQNINSPPNPRPKSKPIPKPDRFTHSSQSFRGYAESRHADTALLYVCHQLRAEASPFYYNNTYYLTLIIEQDVPLITLDSESDDDITTTTTDDNTNNSNNRTAGTNKSRTTKNKDPRNLKFIESDQRAFWSHVARDLKFPSLRTAQRFRSFGVSLFIEESAFKGISAWEGVKNGMSREDIVRILLLGLGENNTSAGTTTSPNASTINTGVNKGESESESDENENENENLRYDNVGFFDYTALKLARDAPDMSVAAAAAAHSSSNDDGETETGTKGREGEEKPSNKKTQEGKKGNVSLSIEMWRV